MKREYDSNAAWIDIGHRLVDAARTSTLKHFRDPKQLVIAKEGKTLGSAHYDPVTEADRGAEASIRTLIESDYPEFGLIGEEFGVLRPDSRLRWVVDPIDGTRSYVCGLPTWTTLLGLALHDEPVVGIVDQPYIGERWIGSSDGAYWSRTGTDEAPRAIRCRPCARIEEACLASTDPRSGAMFSASEAAGFDKLARRARVARFSTDAYGYVLVATGTLDLVIESGLHPYDVAAIVPLITAAGGIVSDWNGAPIRLTDAWDGTIVAAGDVRVHTAALEAISTWSR